MSAGRSRVVDALFERFQFQCFEFRKVFKSYKVRKWIKFDELFELSEAYRRL